MKASKLFVTFSALFSSIFANPTNSFGQNNITNDPMKFLDKNIDYNHIVYLSEKENVSDEQLGYALGSIGNYVVNMKLLENNNQAEINLLKDEIGEHIENKLTLAASEFDNSDDNSHLERRALGLCCGTWKAIACYASMGGAIPACFAGGLPACAAANWAITGVCSSCLGECN